MKVRLAYDATPVATPVATEETETGRYIWIATNPAWPGMYPFILIDTNPFTPALESVIGSMDGPTVESRYSGETREYPRPRGFTGQKGARFPRF